MVDFKLIGKLKIIQIKPFCKILYTLMKTKIRSVVTENITHRCDKTYTTNRLYIYWFSLKIIVNRFYRFEEINFSQYFWFALENKY